MDVWSFLRGPMTSSGIYGDIWCRRRRRLYKNFKWSSDFSYQNSAPFHILNSSFTGCGSHWPIDHQRPKSPLVVGLTLFCQTKFPWNAENCDKAWKRRSCEMLLRQTYEIGQGFPEALDHLYCISRDLAPTVPQTTIFWDFRQGTTRFSLEFSGISGWRLSNRVACKKCV